jgi:hypothetical protein
MPDEGNAKRDDIIDYIIIIITIDHIIFCCHR